METIGFSTACLWRLNIPFYEKIKCFSSFGANALELCYVTPTELNEFKLTSEMIADIKKFDYISIHAPFKEVRYKRDVTTKNIIEKLCLFCEQLSIQGIVIHPDITDDFKYLEKSGLPFLVENMDYRKKFGKTPEHFRGLIKEYNFGFVLDTQHAYENDATMKLGIELISIMGDRLKELHVSGRTQSEIHSLVHASDNRDLIQQALKLCIGVPKIVEGYFSSGNIRQSASNELKFMRKFEPRIKRF
ncbi:MAG: hypothetical protein JSV20_09385 [Candidatus Bathyarchaeota archaeon]|nr:MAG: hypothetical protein JSV20_09385 [Candidatus Bathyarchaeota archaeon]